MGFYIDAVMLGGLGVFSRLSSCGVVRSSCLLKGSALGVVDVLVCLRMYLGLLV